MSSRHEERSPLVEYYSGFPSASTPSVKDAPTVLLFGWFGCRDRYLAKYSALYEQRGHTKCYPAMIRQLYNDVFLTELDLQSHSNYLIHVFSNNGARVLDLLLKHMEHEPDGNKLIGKIRGVAFDRYLLVQRTWAWLKGMLWPASRVPFVFDSLLASPHLPKNKLYIYSTGDEICTPRSIEQFIALRAARDHDLEHRNVLAVKLNTSPHCEHLRYHPAAYDNAVGEFLRAAANGANGDNSDSDNGYVQVNH